MASLGANLYFGGAPPPAIGNTSAAPGATRFTASVHDVAPHMRSQNRNKRQSPSASQAEPSRRQRRDRGPNWIFQEMIALIDAKHDEFLQELDAVDARDLMASKVSRWNRVAEKVMASGFSPCTRDGTACKAKWHLLLPDYRKIVDYHSRTGINSEDYWLMTNAEHVAEKLPKYFSKDMYARIHEWFGRRPQIAPPHVRDLLNPTDDNYRDSEGDSDDEDAANIGDSVDGESIERIDLFDSTPGHTRNSTGLGLHSPSQQVPHCLSSPRVPLAHPQAAQSPGASPDTPGARTSTVLLSSSQNGSSKKKTGNIGVRCKNLSGQAALVEVIKASGDAIAAQMRELAETSKENERNKIEVQLKLFSEQMQYQREKDRRLYEQSLATAYNARLAIEKQGELVTTLASLISTIMSAGLKVSATDSLHCDHPAPTMPSVGLPPTSLPPQVVEDKHGDEATTSTPPGLSTLPESLE